MTLTARDLSLTALMAAFTSAMAIIPAITLPLSPVPITLQTFGVILAGALLGAKRGALAMGIFLLLIVIGAPVLAGFVGGIGVLFTASGGFILSWPLTAWAIGWLVEKNWQRLTLLRLWLVMVVIGTVIMYGWGIPWMAVTMKVSLAKAGLLAMIFIPGDMLKAALAAWVGMVFKQHYPLMPCFAQAAHSP